MSARIDHLVVLAPDLAQGVAWCERTLGITPGPGGQHVFMGTHNRLLRIDSEAYPQAYFEIIAIDPQAAPPTRPRWFDMDAPPLRAMVAERGPQLVHFVASVPGLQTAVQAWQSLGIERGEVVQASRMTPAGPLQWQITIRGDGQRLFDGALPTLIEWGAVHPCDTLPHSGVRLQSLALRHPQHTRLAAALDAIDLGGVAVAPGPASLRATLMTPKGLVQLG